MCFLVPCPPILQRNSYIQENFYVSVTIMICLPGAELSPTKLAFSIERF